MAEFVDGVTTEQLRRYLADVSFPALKNNVVHAARRAQAPNELVAVLERLPLTEFQSLDELIAAYGASVELKVESAPTHTGIPPFLNQKHQPRPSRS